MPPMPPRRPHPALRLLRQRSVRARAVRLYSTEPPQHVGDPPPSWDNSPDAISAFDELPTKNFGVNQHMLINEEFKEALRQVLWQFRAPIRYAFAYGSGVFPQDGGRPPASSAAATAAAASGTGAIHPAAPEAVKTMQRGGGKMIDFIFGVSYSQHWHDLNLHQHRDHYSGLGSLGSYAVSQVQDRWGAGIYFNPYVTVNGTLIKYGVVNIDTLCRDLRDWDTLYLAGRLHKPVKILRDHPRVRLSNQMNLLSAVRVALLLLPPRFTEHQLYTTIAGISYRGDPRMAFASENTNKVSNIVTGQMDYFRRLYAPLIDTLPNVRFHADHITSEPAWVDDPSLNVALEQDMDPAKRGNMVRRLPPSFRQELYLQYQRLFGMPQAEFEDTVRDDPARTPRRFGGDFERRIAADHRLGGEVTAAIHKTVSWPSTVQSVKSLFTSGISRSWRYVREKRQKYFDSKG